MRIIILLLLIVSVSGCASNEFCKTVCKPDENCKRICKSENEWN